MQSLDSETILLVEDEELNSFITKTSLEYFGYKVIQANSGNNAIDAIRENPSIDLILMDLELGSDIDGSKTAEIILKNHNVPIIFLTSHTESEFVEKTDNVLSYGYVTKDSGNAILNKSIKMALRLFNSNRESTQSKIDSFLNTFSDTIFEIGLEGFVFDCYSPISFNQDKPLDIVIGSNISKTFPKEISSVIISKIIETHLSSSLKIPQNKYKFSVKDKWFEISISPKPDPTNEPRFITFFREITNHLEVLETLEEQEIKKNQTYSDLLQRQLAIDQHAIIAITNLAGNITYVNEQFCKISQYRADELIGNNHRILNSGYHPKVFFKEMYSTLKKGLKWEGEIRNRAKDGSIYWVATTIVPLKNTEEKVTQYFALRTVITERKKTEEELHLHQIELKKQNLELKIAKSELEMARTRYFDLYSQAPIGYITVTESCKIVEGNFTASKLFGIDQQSLKDREFTDFILPENRETYKLKCKELLKSESSQSYEIKLLRYPNEQFWAQMEVTVKKKEDGTNIIYIVISDINNRKLVEEKLEFHSKLLANINDAVISVDKNSVITSWNHAAEKIYGWKEEEVIGLSARGILKTEFVKESADNAFKSMSENGYYHGEIIQQRKDGTKIYIEPTAIALKNENGEVNGYVGVNRDITKRKETEFALLASEALATSVANNIPGMVGYWTNDLKCAFANNAYMNWFGKTKEQMQGITMQELLGEELFKKNEPYIHAAMRGESQQFERILIKPNGEQGYLWAQYIPHRINGEQKGFIALVLDITDRRLAEESAIASMNFLNQIINAVASPIFVKTEDHKVCLVNEAYCNLLGLPEDKILGFTGYEYFPKEQFDTFIAKDDEVLKTGKENVHEESLTDSEGNILTIITRKTMYATHTGEKFIVGIINDITESKSTEEKLNNYLEELESLNQTKNKFFNIIAHDLRNPFIGIIEISKHLEKSILSPNESKEFFSSLLKYVQLIQSSSKSAYELLENLMHWARSQTDVIKLELQILNIKEIVTSVIPIIEGIAFNKNIIIDINKVGNENIYADESLVKTILRNIFTNAIKFTNHNGKIELSTYINNKFLEISITDNGVGIDSEHIDKIFRIDSKFSELGTDKETGTGLGLILCREFIEKQGGQIWVTSETGKGSKFTFTLPLYFENNLKTN